MALDSYSMGSMYENFMRRAFPEKGRNMPGMNGREFENLIASENGSNSVDHLGSTHKIITELKQNIDNAMEAFLQNKKLSHGCLAAIEYLRPQIEGADNSEDLHQLILQTLDATQDLLKP